MTITPSTSECAAAPVSAASNARHTIDRDDSGWLLTTIPT
jgi:hypothetical protein